MNMKITLTLGRYLARSYLLNMVLLLGVFLGVLYLFDTVELVRRASKTDVPLGAVLQMGALKLPEVGQTLFPFAILFSAMFTFWQFNRRSELVILRASGFSVWQFLSPVLAMALLVGVLQVGIVNPVGALLVGKYHQLENRYLERQENQIAIFREGLWLRQSVASQWEKTVSERNAGYAIIHARKIVQPDWGLQDLSVFYFTKNDVLLRRLDARQARLKPGMWVFEDVKIFNSDGSILAGPRYILPTGLSTLDIEESFSDPGSMSFWQLPSHIKTLEETGFDASRLRVYYQSLWAQPLFLFAMVLLAAIVSMRPSRMGGGMWLVAAGIFIGFFVFFMSSYLQALGASRQIPPVLAAWSPALICALLGVSVLMNLEDG